MEQPIGVGFEFVPAEICIDVALAASQPASHCRSVMLCYGSIRKIPGRFCHLGLRMCAFVSQVSQAHAQLDLGIGFYLQMAFED